MSIKTTCKCMYCNKRFEGASYWVGGAQEEIWNHIKTDHKELVEDLRECDVTDMVIVEYKSND